MSRLVSYAQNAEDIRVWRATKDLDPTTLTYVDVGANEPRHLSITASLYDLGWRGLLIEADPDLANELRIHRPHDVVIESAAAATSGTLTFYRVPGTGLGTLDKTEARAAFERGFEVAEYEVPARPLDEILDDAFPGDENHPIHFMSIDVEGAESVVLQGLSLTKHRPWIICIEAVEPGTSNPTHQQWEQMLLSKDYLEVAFDGVNRWYVSKEHQDLAGAVSTPFNAIDAGADGWVTETTAHLQDRDNRNFNRRAWQRELILNDVKAEVPTAEYEKQIHELRSALMQVEGSRTFKASRKMAKAGKKVVHKARQVRNSLPGPLNRALIRHRHLKHVTINLGHLTDPAYLGNPPEDRVTWITEERRPPLPERGFDLRGFNASDEQVAREWLAANLFDSDEDLDARMDNHDDEVGRTRAALRTRIRMANPPTNPTWAGGHRILFDARALQSPAFGTRGIGRFALAALNGLKETHEDERITLLIDKGLNALPPELVGECELITRIDEASVSRYSVFIEPSPMTHSADPIIPILHSNAYTLAVVFDFIPMHYPTIYLRHMAARTEYAANLDALKLYSDYVCISHLAKRELATLLGRTTNGPQAFESVVAWPRDVLPKDALQSSNSRLNGNKNDVNSGPIVVMTGDEPRKNTFGALAAIGAATSHQETRDVVVLGMAGQNDRVHHWSIAAAMRPGEAVNAARLSDNEMHELLESASLVVVASFDEGLSLPVIEAIREGAPVVASDIPAHRELLGNGSFLADPKNPKALAKAISKHRGKASTRERQLRKLGAHRHASLEVVVGKKVTDNVKSADVVPPRQGGDVGGRQLKIAIANPWAPQRTGVADFSTTTTRELAKIAEVTVFTTSGATNIDHEHDESGITFRNVDELLTDPSQADEFDVVISVMGNSHYHRVFDELTKVVDTVVVAHDTRMVEYYLALRGRGGVEQVMLTTNTGQRSIKPSLDDQIDDMRLLQNAGFWEIANRSKALVLHSPSSAPRIHAETG
ncbi:MAG: FkbM family methyltransferase, partial [Candidatus Nanopelagicales bacterium]|nr:FkbM family methyltransferase [Candidatus Nanopelagicales bacterium]